MSLKNNKRQLTKDSVSGNLFTDQSEYLDELAQSKNQSRAKFCEL